MKNLMLAALVAGLLVLASLMQANIATGEGGDEPRDADATVPLVGPIVAPSDSVEITPTEAAAEVNKNTDELEPAELEFIEKLRGKFQSPLEGSIFKPDAHERRESFRQAYRELSECQAVAEDAAKPVHRDFADWAPSEEVVLEPAAAVANSLRLSARQLEATAADLEDQNEYDRADKLRQWARRLRQEARSGN